MVTFLIAIAAFWLGFGMAKLQQKLREETKFIIEDGITLKKVESVESAFSVIVRDAQQDLKVGNPGILTSDIAKLAGCSESIAFSAMAELERGIPTQGGKVGRLPCVHRSGDRWYKGDGMRKRGRQ